MVGYVQVYTGEGKGKTTAAMGLALRAIGAGKKIMVCQFLKGAHSSELKALEYFSPQVEVMQLGVQECLVQNLISRNASSFRREMLYLVSALSSGKYDMLIVDEINMAVLSGLFYVSDVLGLIREKPEGVELVLTGRSADPRIIEQADLVTEMHEFKHYYRRGVQAREGIEI